MIQSCSKCQQSFEISDRDRVFYERIQVPEPTHCPSCRMRRRFSYRNERNLYHRKCSQTGKQIISMYHSESPFPVFEQSVWWGDSWEALDHGREYDSSRSFFEQYFELQQVVPRIALLNVNQENSEFCNFTGDVKDSYLVFGPVYSEHCYYGSPYYSQHCIDSLVIRECQWCYECTDCRGCYECFYCQNCTNSQQLIACYDLQNCRDCIGCVGLKNKQYCIFNQQLTQEEYERKREELNLCDTRQRETLFRQVEQLKRQAPHRFMQSHSVENVSGDFIFNAKNTFSSYFADRTEDCSYCAQVVDLKDCYDNNYTEENELCYEYLGMYGAQRTHFSLFCRHTNEVWYSDHCVSSQNLFGCIGLKNKQYCILNKQYSEKSYRELTLQIMSDMKKRGEFGEFFPMRYSPFSYIETVAQEFFPRTQQSVVSEGLNWRESDAASGYQGPYGEVPEDIQSVTDNLLDQILLCEVTQRHYKIIRQELEFYRRFGLPIPKKCPDQRHKERLALRNPRQLWTRECFGCQTRIQTSFAPDRPEKVYCESCYQQLVV